MDAEEKAAKPKEEKKEKKGENDQGIFLQNAPIATFGSFQIPVQNIGMLELPDDKFGCSIILCGSTRSGKTTMLNYLYKKHFMDYISLLMSNSLQSDAYTMLKKHCAKADFYHPEILKELYKINHETNNHYKFFVVIDDIPDKREDQEIKRMLTIYRNSRISCVICAQGLTMMNKLARSNINYVFLGRMNSTQEIERNVKEYLTSYFPTNMRMAEKILLYKELTSDYWWLVLDNINGVIFRTKLRPEQMIGA
jgi:type IV secretory pathway VirB4 component